MNKELSRQERRRIMRNQNASDLWERVQSPKELGLKGSGWFSDLDKAWKNKKYAVMSRTINTKWGTVHHVCIRNISSTDIPWREKQKIKNELFGEEYCAIEVFPPESQLIDEANMYHLWVFNEYALPFGLHRSENTY